MRRAGTGNRVVVPHDQGGANAALFPSPSDGNESAKEPPPEAEDAMHFHHYAPWLIVTGEPLGAVCEEVFASIPLEQPGSRNPRRDAVARRRQAVFNIIANLAVLALSPLRYEAMLVSFRQDKRTRYDRAPFTLQVLRKAVTELERLGILKVEVGSPHRLLTRIRVTPAFVARLRGHTATLANVGKAGTAETIIVRTRGGRGEAGDEVDYVDDEASERLRSEMEDLNAGMSAADIRLDGKPIGPVHMVRIFQNSPAAPWRQHGRIYRAVHLSLPKAERHRLTMGGEELVDLDWKSCHLRIAYAMVGVEPPPGDLYAIHPELAACRTAVKEIISALFSRRPPPAGRPTGQWAFRLPQGKSGELPEGWTGKRFLSAARRHHPQIAHLFGEPDFCFTLFHIEAEMMLAVLAELRAMSCIALPCHDGLLCKEEFGGLAAQTMRAVSLRYLGAEIPVSVRPLRLLED